MESHSHLPLRIEVRRSDALDCYAFNQIDSAQAPLLLADQAIERLSSMPLGEWPLAELSALVEHPDESVRIALAKTLIAHLWAIADRKASEPYSAVLDDLMAQALRQADEEGVLWTPLLDACIDAPDFADKSPAHAQVVERFHRITKIISAFERSELLEPLAGFESSQIRRVQLARAQTIPLSLLDHWIRNSSDAAMALRNSKLMRRHGVAILNRIFNLSFHDLNRLSPVLRTLWSGYFEAAPDGWGDEIITRAISKNAFLPLADVLHQLPGVTAQGIRHIIDSLVDRPAPGLPRSKLTYLPLIHEAILHPACPADIRQRALAGEFGFPLDLVDHPAADAEILDAAWKHEADRVALHVLNHPNVSAKTAIEILRSPARYDIEYWRRYGGLPPCASQPGILVAFLESMLDESRWRRYSTRASFDDMTSLIHCLNHVVNLLGTDPETVAEDPWFNLAISLTLQQMTRLTGDRYVQARSVYLDRLGSIAQHARRPTLDQDVVAQYLTDPSPMIRERMVLLLAHSSVAPGLIERDLAEWRKWVTQATRKETGHSKRTWHRG